MANHKWIDETINKYRKQHRCKKCGVYRDWLGGDMQCWEYWHPDYSKNTIISQHKFKRPECVGK
jgi:hypothetical protein